MKKSDTHKGESERKRLLRRFIVLTGLNIASNLTIPLSSLVDTWMLGHLDEVRFLAGVALSAIIFDFLYWSFGFLRMGTTGLVAMAHGRQDRNEPVRILYRSAAIGGGFGLTALLAAPLIREVGFYLLSGTAPIEAVGRAYFDARIYGAPGVFLNLALSGYFIGLGRSGAALAMATFQNLGNAALNAWFIWGLGLAAQGAGLASMGSQYLALSIGVVLFLTGGPILQQRGIFERRAFVSLFRLNSELFIRTLSMVSVFAVFTNLSAMGGEPQLAAFAILIRMLTTGAYMIDGVAFALESLAGGLWQSKKFDALRALVRIAMGLALCMAGALALVLTEFGPQIYRSLTTHESVSALCYRFQAWMLVSLSFGAVAWIYDGLFIGLTWGARLRKSALLSAAVFVPGAVLAWTTQNPHLLWGAFLLFTLARAMSMGSIWHRSFHANGK